MKRRYTHPTILRLSRHAPFLLWMTFRDGYEGRKSGQLKYGKMCWPGKTLDILTASLLLEIGLRHPYRASIKCIEGEHPLRKFEQANYSLHGLGLFAWPFSRLFYPLRLMQEGAIK